MLCATAHPDDESGAFGGALIMAHHQEVQTAVICLTAGDAGSYRAPGQSDEELATARRGEFAAACRLLGVSHAEVLSYPDGALLEQNFQELIAVLVARIRALRPQVVITFGADGGVNLHRDHTIAGLAASAAFHFAGRPGYFPEAGTPYAPQKLYYASTSFIALRDQQQAAAAAPAPYSLTLELGAWTETKLKAFLQHSSQRGVLERVRADFEQHMNTERYLLAAARPHAIHVGEDHTLFQGVVED